MAQVFTGRVSIPGDKLGEYFEAMKKAEEERKPFRDGLDALNRAFADHLAEKFSERTANKHASIIQMFIEFLCRHTDVQRLEDVTIGIANSHFQTWYRRKVMDSTNDNDRRIAIQKFFLFLAMEKGIVNQKVLEKFTGASPSRAVAKVPAVTKRETVILRSKFAHNKRVYRDIEVPLDSTLYDLAYTIIAAVGFDDTDHAFGFYITDNLRRFRDANERYQVFVDWGVESTPGSKSVKRAKLDRVFTTEGQKVIFLFDYGDEWLFELEVRGFGSKAPGAQYPRTLASKGEAPEQYPDCDGEED